MSPEKYVSQIVETLEGYQYFYEIGALSKIEFLKIISECCGALANIPEGE